MQKSYLYKWYRDNELISTLDNVISEFSLSEEINTAGAVLNIDLGISFENAGPELNNDYLVDENGDYIITEALEKIILAEESTISGFPNLNDVIRVYEYSDYYPNGTKVFEGLVTNWSSNYKDSKTSITVTNYGIELDQYLVQVISTASAVGTLERTGYYTLSYIGYEPSSGNNTRLAQTFKVGQTTTVTGARVSLYIPGVTKADNYTVTLELIEGSPASPSTIVGSSTRVLAQNLDYELITFTFASDITLVQSQTYHLKLTMPSLPSSGSWTGDVYVGVNNSNEYPDGTMFSYYASAWHDESPDDMIFQIDAPSGGLGNVFNSYDPSNIVTELIDSYNELGGRVTYDTDTIELSNTTVSYTFKYNTYLDGIKKTLELAPSNWWWRVDPATNIIYFQSQAQTADHTLTLGKEITNMNIARDITQVKNTVYFTGGDTGGGENLVTNTLDVNSVEKYGTWLSLISDNRVTTTGTAEILMDSELREKRTPRFMTSVEISDTAIDTKLIKIGDIVGFANFNSLIDSLTLQVMRKTTTSNGATLELAVLPPTVPKRIEDIKRNLILEQSKDNPAE